MMLLCMFAKVLCVALVYDNSSSPRRWRHAIWCHL